MFINWSENKNNKHGESKLTLIFQKLLVHPKFIIFLFSFMTEGQSQKRGKHATMQYTYYTSYFYTFQLCPPNLVYHCTIVWSTYTLWIRRVPTPTRHRHIITLNYTESYLNYVIFFKLWTVSACQYPCLVSVLHSTIESDNITKQIYPIK